MYATEINKNYNYKNKTRIAKHERTKACVVMCLFKMLFIAFLKKNGIVYSVYFISFYFDFLLFDFYPTIFAKN